MGTSDVETRRALTALTLPKGIVPEDRPIDPPGHCVLRVQEGQVAGERADYLIVREDGGARVGDLVLVLIDGAEPMIGTLGRDEFDSGTGTTFTVDRVTVQAVVAGLVRRY